MKLNSPLVGVGIGGGASALTQIALRMGAQKVAGDGSSKVRVAVARNPGIVGLAVGGIGAGVLYLLKKKEAAIGAGIGTVAASVPGIVLDYQAKKALAAMTPAATETPAATGTGLAVATRKGFGAPVVELFGAPASNIEVFGTPQSGSASFNPAAFGGGSF